MFDASRLTDDHRQSLEVNYKCYNVNMHKCNYVENESSALIIVRDHTELDLGPVCKRTGTRSIERVVS